MADIFISYTSSDRDWAFWIAQELEKLGHTPRVHEWEIPGGGDILGWMEKRLQAADHALCVTSNEYLHASYSILERRAAHWAAARERPNFALSVLVKRCEVPLLFAHIKRCHLYDFDEDEARAKLKEFLQQPVGKPTEPTPFPGDAKRNTVGSMKSDVHAFPGQTAHKLAISNISIRVPLHFMGRDDALTAIQAALKCHERAAITALLGLRGVGKTTLAAAYAERHRSGYRATWWIRAQTEASLRADLVALGIHLGWITADEKENPALAAALEKLRDEGEGILLIYDNAIDADALRPYLPRGGATHVLITSNAHAWRGIAEPIEIAVWPKEIGAEYLIARTSHENERFAAEALSEALGGLPLAHEQAAAYCERLEVSLAEYRKRFEATPAKYLDDSRHAPVQYGLTVAKTFALAIDEAAKLHPAAEPLIVYAALLAPTPIPLFLFTEGREKFDEPLATALSGDGLYEAVAALRSFALVERESVADERDPFLVTNCLRLHRLVRQVAAARHVGVMLKASQRALLEVLADLYPSGSHNKPISWPYCALLSPHLLAICEVDWMDRAVDETRALLLCRAGNYFHSHAAFSVARSLYERALAICEEILGPEHLGTATVLNNLATLLKDEGDLMGARPFFERSLAICEKVNGPEHTNVAPILNNLADLLCGQGDLIAAEAFFKRALAIREKVLGSKHIDTALSFNSLAGLLYLQGDLARARPLFERALVICEDVHGSDHPAEAAILNNMACLLKDEGDLIGSRRLIERALAIREKLLGPEHPDTALSLIELALLYSAQGDFTEAQPLFERALAIREKVLGPGHWETAHLRARLDALSRDLHS